MRTSTSGLARPKTTGPGTTYIKRAISMASLLPAPGRAAQALAFEEILIAEGSDWNWWYGPEHHSANDRDFDELYRKHLIERVPGFGGRPSGLSRAADRGRTGPAFFHPAKRLHSSPRSPATWCATSSGWAPRATPPTGDPAPCTASSFCWTPSMRESTKNQCTARLDFAGKVPADRI